MVASEGTAGLPIGPPSGDPALAVAARPVGDDGHDSALLGQSMVRSLAQGKMAWPDTYACAAAWARMKPEIGLDISNPQRLSRR
jgi:hypothetical protein